MSRPHPGSAGILERTPETDPEPEPVPQPETERIDWAPCGAWMDPDTAEWIDRDPSRRGA